MRIDLIERKEEILQWVSENRSKAYMARELGCNPKTINTLLEKLGITYNGNQSGKGFPKNDTKYMPVMDYLQESDDIQSDKVRKKLLKEGYKEYRCECCGLDTWMNAPIPLELHHIDGNRYNNNLDNFQLLCPNCHAQTDTWRGKNTKPNKCVETIDHLPKS